MHFSEQTIMVAIQGIGTVFVALLAAYFRAQLLVLKEVQTQKLLEFKTEMIEKLDAAALNRQTMISSIREALVDKIDQKASSIISEFVPLSVCELVHRQIGEKFTEVIRRLEHVENQTDVINKKIDGIMAVK